MYKKILKLFGILSIVFCSFSCKNFLSGSDLINDLNEQIYIANHERPKAKIISPINSPTGDYKNASIIIEFTKPINTESFDKAFILVNDKNESIKNNYSVPVWNEEKTMVTISANEKNLLDIAENNYANITIKLTKELYDTENVPIENEISQTFKLNSSIDKEKPEFISFKLGKNSDFETELITDSFIDATKDTIKTIVTTNHIQNTIFYSCEAHDYGDNIAFINFQYKRIYTSDGKPVEEDELSQTIKLNDPEENETTSKLESSFLLDNEKCLDGLYQFDVYLSDAANNKSDEVKRYYILKDTIFELPSSAAINCLLPDWRKKDQRINFPIKLDTINTSTKTIELYYYADDCFFIFNNEKYSTSLDDIKFSLSYGLGPDNKTDIVTPIASRKEFRGYEDAAQTKELHSYVLDLPEEIHTYFQENANKHCYLEVHAIDEVGNKVTKSSYFAKTPVIFNYTIENNLLTLNFDDKGFSTIQNELNLQDYTIDVRSRIFYAKKTPGSTVNNLVFKRNFMFSEIDNPNDGDPENGNPNNTPRYNGEIDNDPWDSYSDKNSLLIDPNYEYVVIIMNSYIYNKNNYWVGTMSSIPLIIDNISINNLNQDTNFANNFENTIPIVTKQLQAKSTGLTKISIDTSNLPTEDGVSYYYGWNANDTWNYYSTNEFIVNTYIMPPEFTETNTNSFYTDYLQYMNQNNRKELSTSYPPTPYSNKCKVKIFAKKGNSVKESQEAIVTFYSTEDNISPTINEWKHAHDLTVSADGTFFYTDNLCADDIEWNDGNYFTYYFTDYNKAWGNEIHILSKEQILKLPQANQRVFKNLWLDNTTIKKTVEYDIPVNGLKDGDYMIFFTVKDKYDNSTTDGLGKIHIGTYKNNLNVSYAMGANNQISKINASLSLDTNEPHLSNNNIFVRYFETSNQNPEYNTWLSFCKSDSNAYYEASKSPANENYNAVNKMTINGNTLTFETNNTSNYTPAGKNNFESLELPSNVFYKFNVTSFNIDPKSYLDYTEYGNHTFNVPADAESIPSQIYYDAYLDETVSYPTYLFLPQKENVHSFFEKTTATVMSDNNMLINVISSLYNLGDNIDEWERRGKTVYSSVKTSSGNTNATFGYNDAINAMFEANEQGKRYFVVIAHFADNTSGISKVFECN